MDFDHSLGKRFLAREIVRKARKGKAAGPFRVKSLVLFLTGHNTEREQVTTQRQRMLMHLALYLTGMNAVVSRAF